MFHILQVLVPTKRMFTYTELGPTIFANSELYVTFSFHDIAEKYIIWC
jgi:hypothetical protein